MTDFPGHAYLFPGTLKEWQPRIAEFLATFSVPDIKTFEQTDARSWGIAEVRGLIAWAHLKPYAGARKLALLEAVERFTPDAADAFLKTLEEPPASTIFFLFTRFPGGLRETVRSRLTPMAAGTPGGVPEPSQRYRQELRELFSLPLAGRLESSARWAADAPALEERLTGWLAALRASLMGNDAAESAFEERLTIRRMRELLKIGRLLRETNSQPRLLLDSFMLLW